MSSRGCCGTTVQSRAEAALQRCDVDFHVSSSSLFSLLLLRFLFVLLLCPLIGGTYGAVLSALSKPLRRIRINVQDGYSLIVPHLSDEITQVATITQTLKSVSRSSGDAAEL